MKKYGYDVYFNGHEHQMNYAQVPMEPNQWKPSHKDKDCKGDTEVFPQNGPEKESRAMTFKKGEIFHEMTLGASGKDRYPICTDHETSGKFFYTQNKYQGFGLVTVTPENFTVKMMGVKHNILGKDQLLKLFEVTIENSSADESNNLIQ